MKADLNTILALYEEKLLNVAKTSMKTVTTSVVEENTPVLSGALKESWTPNNGGAKTGGGGGFDGVIDSIEAGDTYTVATDKPYAPRIEYEAYSQKSPQGMVQPAVGKWQKTVDDAVKKEK